MLRLGLLAAAFSLAVVWVGQATTFPIEYDVDLLSRYFSKNILSSSKRALTEEEQELVARTRAHLADVLQRNLYRLLGAYVSRGRQDDDEDDEETATFNPNTLPQVAALLGSIFSGNLNLTNVVDKAFFLVPDTVRTQVSGIFKLISGQPNEEPTPAPTVPPAPVTPAPATEAVKNVTEPIVTKTVTTTTPAPKTTPRPTKSTPRKKWPNAPDIAVPPEARSGLDLDDEPLLTDEEALAAVERHIKANPDLYEAYVKEKSPRYFLEPLRKIFKSNELNLTTVYQVMPELFKGARQTFVLLESLGEATGLTGGGTSEDNDDS